MATQVEIEAAAEAIRNCLNGLHDADPGDIAKLALEAAERVRPRRDLTAAARMRQSRAKRRAERAVTRAVTSERAVTGDATRAVTGAVPRAATDDVGNVPGRLAEIIDTDDLLVKLLDAAGGNVHSGANDTAPIAGLLEQGCDLDLDVLPAVRHLLTDPIQPPLRRWSVPWLGEEIIRRRDARMASDRLIQAPAAARAAPTRPAPGARPRTSVPPDMILASVADDPAVKEAAARWDRATPSTHYDLVRARDEAQARMGIPVAKRAFLYSADVDSILLPIVMRMAPGNETATAQALTRDFNERYRDLGPRVLAFCLSTYQHGNIDGLKRAAGIA